MRCCPPTAWGALEPPTGYTPRGEISKVPVDGGDMEVYRVRPASGECSEDIVVYWMYDIGGANQGRTKALCDTFADCCVCEVVLCDVYLGDATDWKDIPGFLQKYATVNCEPRYMKLIDGEKRKMVFIGTCWGTLLMHSIYANFPGLPYCCGIQYHPSTRAAGYEGKDEFELAAKCKVPQMVLPAEDDEEQYQPGGKTIQILETGAPVSVGCPPLPKTFHGFVPRGDVTELEMRSTVEKAIQMAVDFIQKMRQCPDKGAGELDVERGTKRPRSAM